MGLWGSLAILSGLGPEDPSSNLGSPAILTRFEHTQKQCFWCRTRDKLSTESGYTGILITKVLTMKGSSKKFGVRYGRRLRMKHEGIETEQKTKYPCPYCHKIAVKRMAVGIWTCPKCAAVFTGRAYNIPKKAGLEEQQHEEIVEEIREEPEEYAEEELQEQQVQQGE